MLVDSHCHIHLMDLTEFEQDPGAVVQRAVNRDVTHMLCVGTRFDDHATLVDYANQFANVDISVGVHPNEAAGQPLDAELLKKLGENPSVVAIGETGLDYYRCEGDMGWQQERFARHIDVAKQLNKPLIIHTRQAPEDTARILKHEQADTVGGVMHCFTESWDLAKKSLDIGFYISISGIVSFKNAKQVQDVAKKVPLTSLLIETDSPWLAPVPFRGKQNEPGYVREVADFLSQIRPESFEEIARVTSENYFKLFHKRTDSS